jgi:UDP-N-acetylglucosamine 2-epimerase (non-hydrolysing)
MKVLSVVGARPQLVKLAPVAAALAAAGHEHVIVHTGQHYDPALSEVFFDGLGIPEPDVRLCIGSGSHGEQTGAMLAALEPVLATHEPDWVLVYGDTNSTLAAAVCAVKQHLPLAHLEAGLRSFNRAMPEEHNRVLTDHAADLLLAPTDEAVRHLRDEGLAARTVLVGDVMVDVCHAVRDTVTATGYRPPLPEGVDPEQPYLLATIHRAENTDERDRLTEIIDALADLPVPVVLPAHPRLVARAKAYEIELTRGAIRLTQPLPYRDLVAAVLGAVGVVTDSGGLQKEAYLLGRVCTTVRSETEWPETLVDQWNVLVPRPGASAPRLASCALRTPPEAPTDAPYGDGKAATRVATTLAATRVEGC